MRYPPVYLMIPVAPLQTATNLVMSWIFTQLPAEFQCRCNVAATLCGPLGRIALGPLLISQCFFYYTGPSRCDPVAKTAAAQAAPLALVP